MPYTYIHPHRVRYRECDPMGVVYHTHYLDYFEAARTEALREAGLPYKALEGAGVMTPVVDLAVRYKAPAYYDDVLLIESRIGALEGTRIRIDYRIARGEEGQMAETPSTLPEGARPLVTGHVTLCFVDAERRRPVYPPDAVKDVLLPYLAPKPDPDLAA